MSDQLARSWRDYPLVVFLSLSTGIGSGYDAGRGHLDWMTGQRDRYETDLEAAQSDISRSVAEPARLTRLVAEAASSAKQLSTELTDHRTKKAELEGALQQAGRDLAGKVQQIEPLVAENASLKRQIASLKPAPPARLAKIEDQARPLITALYRGGNISFVSLKKELDMADGAVRHHVIALHRIGLIDYLAYTGSDDILSAKLTAVGLRYASDNGLR